jgi:basic amino acid/polyamine antiporter, APA family
LFLLITIHYVEIQLKTSWKELVMTQEIEKKTNELKREFSLLDTTMISVGSMIGSGIFLVPVSIALFVHTPFWSILAWIIGGIVTLFGALSISELGTMYPSAGGLYVYLREAYGKLWGFLYGWSAFAVIRSASISAVAVGFATYLGYFFPFTQAEIKIVAITSIVLLTVINCFGVKLGAIVQNILTVIKIGTLAIVALLGVFYGTFSNLLSSSVSNSSLIQMSGPFGLALVAVLWAYDGWIQTSFVAGEVKEPQKNIPRALIISTLLVMLIYVTVNLSYIAILSIEKISKSTLVVSDAITVVVGPIGAALAAVAVIISTLGCNNGLVLAPARIYYAMAKEKMFFKGLAQVHPKFLTPLQSLITQGIWASLLVLTGTFDQLITYVVFASWIFYAMAASAVILLRKNQADISRPYKTWGYPFTPIIFILFSLYLVVNTLIENPRDSVIGLGLILLGLPAYWYWNRKIKK